MTPRLAILFALVIVASARAQSVSDPKASYIDIPQRHAQLANNKDPRTASLDRSREQPKGAGKDVRDVCQKAQTRRARLWDTS
jgi:hypothetical protein